MKKQSECITPLEKSNKILQMKSRLKKLSLGINTYSCYDYKSAYYNYNTINLSIEEKTGRNIICYISNKRSHKAFQCRNKRREDFLSEYEKAKPFPLF